MSNEETRLTKLRMHVPEDGNNAFLIDDLDTECSVPSTFFDSEMNDSEDNYEYSEESVISDNGVSNFENWEESEFNDCEDSDLENSKKSDGLTVENNISESLEMCPKRKKEKIIDELLDNLFIGESIKDNFEKFPALYLLEKQKSIEFTDEMLQELILDKVGFLMQKEFQLTNIKRVRRINQYRKEQLEKLKQMLDFMNEELDELPMMPPPSDKILHVRNVGIQVNMIPNTQLRNEPEKP